MSTEPLTRQPADGSPARPSHWRLHLMRIARVAVALAMSLTSGLVFAKPAQAAPVTYCVPQYYLFTSYGFARPCTRKLDSGSTRRGLHNRATGEIYYSGSFFQGGHILIKDNALATDGFSGFFSGTHAQQTAYGLASYGIHAGATQGRFGWYNFALGKVVPDGDWLTLVKINDDSDPTS
jgi:hypothetical protein